MKTRGRAALLFGLAAMAAAAVHVAVDTPGAMRDWRQTLPLAAILGAGLGWAMAPRGAARGALLAVWGFAGFAAVFALGHGLIEAARGAEGPVALAGRAFGQAILSAFGPTGAAALGLGALAGWACGRWAPSRG